MPITDPVALLAALIGERPLCIWCSTDVTRVGPQRIRTLLEGVKGYREELGRCTGCGMASLVVWCERQLQRNGGAPHR